MVLRIVLLLADKNYSFIGLRIIFRGVACYFLAHNTLTRVPLRHLSIMP